jgi:hypothetical protein
MCIETNILSVFVVVDDSDAAAQPQSHPALPVFVPPPPRPASPEIQLSEGKNIPFGFFVTVVTVCCN